MHFSFRYEKALFTYYVEGLDCGILLKKQSIVLYFHFNQMILLCMQTNLDTHIYETNV